MLNKIIMVSHHWILSLGTALDMLKHQLWAKPQTKLAKP